MGKNSLDFGAFCNTFDRHKAIIGIENQCLVFYLSDRSRQVLQYTFNFSVTFFKAKQGEANPRLNYNLFALSVPEMRHATELTNITTLNCGETMK